MSAQTGWELVVSDRFRSQIMSQLRRSAMQKRMPASESAIRKLADRFTARLIGKARPSGPPRRSDYGGIMRLFGARTGRSRWRIITQRAGSGIWSIVTARRLRPGE